ncbi:MAG: DUF1003 domain-containing protein [Hyphomicrobiales bacterium]|nr:DUF1003 domain-containing protein [Hyphomicrobiales bacterium]
MTHFEGAPELPAHIDETIQSIARMHAERREGGKFFRRAMSRATAVIGGPSFVAALIVTVVAWIAVNLLLSALGRAPFDEPPFFWLSGAASVLSLFMVAVVVAEQRREDQIALQRELLAMQLAILNEQKTAKVIALLEELRRDSPHIHNRVDAQAEELARATDPSSVLDVIKQPEKPPHDGA